MEQQQLKVAVVGAGVAGITAAYLLARKHSVTLFERNNYLGGHTNTIQIPSGPDAGTAVDTGFIVCNPRNYPLFYRFLDQLGIPRRDSDMSFGYSCSDDEFGYVGPAFRDFIKTPQNLLRPGFMRMILDQQRFNAQALKDLAQDSLGAETLGQYTERLNLSHYFISNYLIPLAAAIWSSPDEEIMSFPARTFIQFFKNHGMLELHRRPTWQTVVGGSKRYIDAFRTQFTGTVVGNDPVVSVERLENKIIIRTSTDHVKNFDKVIFATHANEALAALANPTADEQRLLGTWKYHPNDTVLHTDARVVSPNRSLWASWNYRRSAADAPTRPVSITYYMNRLQGLQTKEDYFVTLNRTNLIDPQKIIYQTTYTHPCFTTAAIASQAPLRALNGTSNTFFCGSYLGYGFHEDAVRSAVEVAEKFGITL